MVFPRIKLKIYWILIAKAFGSAVAVFFFFVVLSGVYIVGVIQGYQVSKHDEQGRIAALLELISERTNLVSSYEKKVVPTPIPTIVPSKTIPKSSSWGGPELWAAVNKRRIEFGVNPLAQRDELCTIASIRLNEQLELGRLDNHEGFTNMKDRRQDLAWIFEKYSTLAEFLAQGGKSASETVSLWENTLGHKKLLTGGEFVWGCIYAQDTFAVAITAY
jgi:hypothetical protein